MTRSTLRTALSFAALSLLWAALHAPPAGAITFKGIGTATTNVVVHTDQEHPWSGVGLALLDMNGDGLLDLVTSGGQAKPPQLWRNDGNLLFTALASDQTGLPAAASSDQDLRGIAAADFDNDGDTDLFIANYHPTGNSLLLRNEGNHFIDITAAAGISIDGRATTAAWGDYDGDGLLDLHVTRYFLNKSNLLLHNLGDGTFLDVAWSAGLTVPPDGTAAYSYHSMWFDVDRDGDQDLYVANDRCYGGSPGNRLWINDGDGTFHEDAASAGLDVCYDGMGLSLGDLDQDGDPELFLTNVAYGHLLLSSSCGKFSDITQATGTTAFQWGWGSLFADLDHNMWPDLYIAHQSTGSGDPTDRLFLNEAGTLTEVAATALSVDHGESFVVVRADLDLDGDQDLIVSRVGLDDTTRVLRNDGPTGHYLRVLVEGTVTNRDGLGAVVDVLAGGMWQRQVRHEAATFGGRGDPALLFGLADNLMADEVRVYWPSGATQVTQDVGANQVLHLIEPAQPGDAEVELFAERCGDGVDNDCDNAIDEAMPVGDGCTTLYGGCEVAGVWVCSSDLEEVVCEASAPDQAPELCGNGLDDDCDGDTDEGFAAGEPCQSGAGSCAVWGVWQCTGDGLGVVCSATGGTGSIERCGNGLDDDCDGDTDEGYPVGAACVDGAGACAVQGTWACSADQLGLVCDAPPLLPQAELCGNGIDDDCDGDTDEGFDVGAPCTVGVGACAGAGLTACAASGLAVTCAGSPGAPQEELCNLVDDDCDGDTDEGFDAGAGCTLGTGACAAQGVRACKVDGKGTACLATPGDPADELCGNSVDDDCDGDTDEGFDVGALCSVGTGGCAQVGVVMCTADASGTSCDADYGPAAAERCGNAVDDDCDGDTDEGYDAGAPCLVGVGACAAWGVRLCSPGGYATLCVGSAAAPSPERCGNGVDDDCDGETDEGPAPGGPCRDDDEPDAGGATATSAVGGDATERAAADAPAPTGSADSSGAGPAAADETTAQVRGGGCAGSPNPTPWPIVWSWAALAALWRRATRHGVVCRPRP